MQFVAYTRQYPGIFPQANFKAMSALNVEKSFLSNELEHQ